MKWICYVEWFSNLKIFNKLLSIVFLMAIFLVTVGLMGYYYNKSTNKLLLHVYEDDLLSIEWLNDIRVNNKATEADIYKLIFISDPVIKQESILDISKRASQLETALTNYEKTYLDSSELKMYLPLKNELIDYINIRDKTIQLAISGNSKQALDYYLANKFKFDNLNNEFNNLAKYADKEAKNAYIKHKSDISFENKLIMAIILLSLLISVPLSLLLARFITKALSGLLDNANEVAKGNLEVSDVKVMSSDEVGKLAVAFNQMTQNLRNSSTKEKELRKREQILREIIQSSLSTLSINDILGTVVIQTGRLFNADRCFFIEYNDQDKEYSKIKNNEVYIASLNIKDLTGVKFTNEQMAPLTKILFDQKQIMAINDINELIFPEVTKNILDEYGIKCILLVPVFHDDIPLGIIGVDYINEYKQFTQDDIDLLSDIANQSAIFIYQAGLYAKIKETRDREKLLRVIINQILVSENIDDAVFNISKEISKIFNADRVNLRFFDPVQKIFTNITGEYRKNENIPFAGDRVFYKKEVNEFIANKIFGEKENLIINNINDPNYPEYLRQNFQEFGAKSIIICPVIHKNIPLALIAITNTEDFKYWRQHEIDLLIPILQQISIGINLFNLNNKLNKSLQSEKIVRKIITEIRKSEDHNIIFDYLLEQFLKIFDADRTLHIHYEENHNFVVYNEKLSNKNQEPLLKQHIPIESAKGLLFKGFTAINDIEIDIKDVEFKEYLKSNGIKSLLIYSTTEDYSEVAKEKKFATSTLICSSVPREWLLDEIDAFKLIVDSATIVYLEIKQRKEVEEMRSTFIATLTHDLRSPIIAEQKAIEFMLSKGLEHPLKNYAEYIEDIHKTNEDLLSIVNNLLAVYHYELGRLDLSLEPVNMIEIVDENIRFLRHLAKDRLTEIVIDMPQNLPLVQIDKNEISRVFVNLMSNAIKHNKKGIKIIITAEQIDKSIQVSIIDNGGGIPEAEIPSIFEKYPTIKRKVGTGLGLYLSKQIINAHNGKIWFTTKQGEGTTFTFTLPISYSQDNG